MLPRRLSWEMNRRLASLMTWRPHRPRRAEVAELARRLAYFWLVWSGLLLVHEAGHALSALEQGLEVRRVTVGVGPVLWRGEHPEAQLVLRLVPIAGVTSVDAKLDASPRADADAWSEWSRHGATLAGGVIATLAAALALAIVVAARERRSGRRWVLARMVIADAVVLTVFNFLPVPPLDGGRAVLAAVSAWRGTPLSGDALFWVQLGGLALAVVPMTLWTRWTARIDALALWWRAPKRAS